MIAAELVMSHTCEWDKPDSVRAEGPPNSDGPYASNTLEFSYELHANPDVWLIGGRRRGNFMSKPGTVETFPVMLLPQRPGHLLLPSLEVKSFALERTTSDKVSYSKTPVISEVDYRNHAHTILVLPDLRSTTVSLEGPGGGSWLVDSERRVDISG